jgi:hypothetical protein
VSAFGGTRIYERNSSFLVEMCAENFCPSPLTCPCFTGIGFCRPGLTRLRCFDPFRGLPGSSLVLLVTLASGILLQVGKHRKGRSAVTPI